MAGLTPTIGLKAFYVGPGDLPPLQHQVIDISPGAVTTWSTAIDAPSPGQTWLGTPKDFSAQFSPIPPASTTST